jgi:hypothetical protein
MLSRDEILFFFPLLDSYIGRHSMIRHFVHTVFFYQNAFNTSRDQDLESFNKAVAIISIRGQLLWFLMQCDRYATYGSKLHCSDLSLRICSKKQDGPRRCHGS